MNELNISVRPKSYLEAVSEGFMLAKRHFFILWPCALIAYLPPALFSFFIYKICGFLWGVLALWWLKVIIERNLIIILGSLLAHEKPKPKLFWQAFYRSYGRGLFRELTLWRILISTRIARAAVLLLEKVEPAFFRKRMHSLERHMIFVLRFRTLWSFSLFHSALIISLMGITLFIIKEPNISNSFYFFELATVIRDHLETSLNIIFIFLVLTSSINAVFFTSVGISVYLNQRIIQEGWATALQLQKLAKKLLPCIFILSTLIIAPENSAQNIPTDREYLESIIEDKNRSPFNGKRQQSEKETKTEIKIEKKTIKTPTADKSLHLIIIIAVITITLFIIIKLWQNQHQFKKTIKNTTKNTPTTIKYSAPLKRSEIDRLLEHGDCLGALALLYRLSLEKFALNITPADAPLSCLKHINTLNNQALKTYFQELTQTWIESAFAGKPLDKNTVQKLHHHALKLWKTL